MSIWRMTWPRHDRENLPNEWSEMFDRENLSDNIIAQPRTTFLTPRESYYSSWYAVFFGFQSSSKQPIYVVTFVEFIFINIRAYELSTPYGTIEGNEIVHNTYTLFVDKKNHTQYRCLNKLQRLFLQLAPVSLSVY